MISYEGDRCRLRPLRMTDLPSLVAWRNDPLVRDNLLGYRLPANELTGARWLEGVLVDQTRTRIVLGIEDREDDHLVGWVSLHEIDWISGVGWFGIVIGERQRRGQGLGSDAMRVLFANAFRVLNLRKISLKVAAYNRPALRLYEAFGFEVEGRARRHVYLDNRYHDVLLMSLWRERYQARQRRRGISRRK